MTLITPTEYNWPAVHEIPQREFFGGPAFQWSAPLEADSVMESN